MSGRVLGVVPARLASTRLPEKPLHPVLGRPLIEWVWKRVSAIPVLDAAVVATDSERIADVCRAFGAPVILTSPEHESGTDRVAEVARHAAFADATCVVNIQGDEPLIEADDVAAAVALVTEGGWDIGTCAAPIGDAEAYHDPAAVKVARASDGRALYFSRAPIPHRRDGAPDARALGSAPFLRHMGVYAFRRDALQRWVTLEPSPLEQLERLEQLRALEGGLRIGVALAERAWPGVDTPGDVARVEARLKQLQATSIA